MNIINKNKLLIALFVFTTLIATIIGITSSFAYIKEKSNILTNNITVGSIETDIEEETPTIDGSIISKNPQIKNNGINPALVRVRIMVTPENLWNCENPNSIDENKIGIDIDTNLWKYNSNDGYYYYQGVLKPNESVSVFSKVTNFTDEQGKAKYNVNSLEIAIYQESIQTFVRDTMDDSIIIDAYENNIFNTENADKVWYIFDNLYR